MQPELFWIEFGAFCHRLEAVEEIKLRLAPGSRKEEITSLVCFCLPRFKALDELRRDALTSTSINIIAVYFANYEFEDYVKNEALQSTYSSRSE